MSKIACIIPSRLNSYRFPRKALVDILHKPMIQHVYERACLSSSINNEVYVATPDEEIIDVVDSFGGKALKTRQDCPCPTSRIFEAAKMINADLIVDVQGDEPLVRPEMIELAVNAYESSKNDSGIMGLNLMRKTDFEEAQDHNKVKVAFDSKMNALFYSREAIPSRWLGDKKFSFYIVVAVFIYPIESLELFEDLKMSPLEYIESIDMLRFLENGYKIKMAESPYQTYSVDEPQDVEKVISIMKRDAFSINLSEMPNILLNKKGDKKV